MMNRDKTREELHNARILPHAEIFWGWATRAGQQRVRRRIQLISQFGDFRTGMRILEIGCGTGIFTQYLADSEAELTAIDLSPQFINKARLKQGAKNARFCACDVERLCFSDNTFDVVLGISILHHLELITSFAEIKRVLKNDGRIIFTEPNMLNPQIFFQKNVPLLKRLAGDSPEESAFVRWKLERFLKEEAFRDVQIYPFDFLHPFLPPVAIAPAQYLGRLLEKVPLVREIAGSLMISATVAKSYSGDADRVYP